MTLGAQTPRAVAIGGGTGLPTVLACLIDAGYDTSAVVTMADDGGSTGTLRRELGILPPGDVRSCLVAMAEPESSIGQLFAYRFMEGEGLAGHALGNLILAALADIQGSFPEAIDTAAELLGARGTVLPCTLDHVVLHATDAHGTPFEGQALIAHTTGPFSAMTLEPERPPAYAPALEAIAAADLIVVGPGSLFTSIIPNFLVDGVAEAVRESDARRVYICNVANQRGETTGMDAEEHVRALWEHGLADAIDVVIVHDSGAEVPSAAAPRLCEDESPALESVDAGPAVRARIESLGPSVIAASLTDTGMPHRHDRSSLCEILRKVR